MKGIAAIRFPISLTGPGNRPGGWLDPLGKVEPRDKQESIGMNLKSEVKPKGKTKAWRR